MPKIEYPASEGWIRMNGTLHKSDLLTEDQLKNIATFGSPEKYEFGTVRQNGKRFLVISRELKRIPQPGEH